jgi:crotonobetainyl-CoA:carnitine CoA-transferase CaiB-like acyl-CoA transferase
MPRHVVHPLAHWRMTAVLVVLGLLVALVSADSTGRGTDDQ